MNAQRILFATHNRKKQREVQEILRDAQIEVIMLDDLPEDQQRGMRLPEETGATYEENAFIKARAAGDATGFLTLADDSGLEVRALPVMLGVRSKRFAEGTDQERNEKLLQLLQGVSDRAAKFVCCMVVYDPERHKHRAFTGVMHGTIALAARGTSGFGYDPLFIPEGYDKTNAELGLEVKNRISHRRKALEQLRDYLYNAALP